MLKKLLIVSLLSMSASFAHAKCFNGTAAHVCGPASEYSITIDQVELCKSSSCSDSVIVSSTSASFDIAASTAGGAVGNYADLDDVAAGIYTHVKTTIAPSITYAAPAIAGECGAVSSTTVPITTSILSVSDLSSNSDFNLSWESGDLVHRMELDQPVVISKAGSLPQVQIDFSTAHAHYCVTGPDVSSPGAPYVTIKVLPN